ncbi:MAG TPA: M28 family peptidase [Longimicrobiales bacterium]|nr:M28 family peptidase [Longimicrobiales bacterium]
MRRRLTMYAVAVTLFAGSSPALAQSWAVEDPVLRAIWEEGMNNSQVMRIAQTLMDSVGPRLTGTPGYDNAANWAVSTLNGWGVQAQKEQYGTWHGWRRGITHVDLVRPRLRSLEGMMLAYSPGTGGRPVEAQVVAVPEVADSAAWNAFLGTVRGRIVARSAPQITCRPNDHYERFGQTFAQGGGFGGPGGGQGQQQQGPRNALEKLTQERTAANQAFNRNKPNAAQQRLAIENAGALAILESNWSNDLGVNKIFDTQTTRIPTIDISCEDYGLVYRLAANNQGPVVRITAESENLGMVPVHNVIGMVRGSQLPNEYVFFSAHYDSWDGGSGATDNGTGSSMMLEAMRILRTVYPNPKRTLAIGLWGGEEQGLNGSRRYVAMHPEIVDNIQVLFNQDNGTGRVQNISMSGFINAGRAFGEWMGRLPSQLSGGINLQIPGSPGTGGTDHVAFLCAGAPAFNLSALSWDYGTATWHTNRDTYDKIVADDIRMNATLAAMLAYLASEHPERVSRDKRYTGQIPWPPCQPGAAQSPRAAQPAR